MCSHGAHMQGVPISDIFPALSVGGPQDGHEMYLHVNVYWIEYGCSSLVSGTFGQRIDVFVLWLIVLPLQNAVSMELGIFMERVSTGAHRMMGTETDWASVHFWIA